MAVKWLRLFTEQIISMITVISTIYAIAAASVVVVSFSNAYEYTLYENINYDKQYCLRKLQFWNFLMGKTL